MKFRHGATRADCLKYIFKLAILRQLASALTQRTGTVAVCLGSRPCENALVEASGSAVSAAAAITQRVEFSGEGPAPYAFIAAISGPVPRILMARFRL
jgi:dissimilatory sulfite reductase (desulfoviridin) alpha/beta subunit